LLARSVTTLAYVIYHTFKSPDDGGEHGGRGQPEAADANRARFGRTKSERALDEHAKDQASHLLDQHRIDDGDAS
jgi:hypothetical protein